MLPKGTPVARAMGVPPERLIRKASMRRQKRNLTSTTHGTPLRGQFEDLGLWYLTLDIGTPPKPYTVQVDTGSSDLGLPDTSCGSSCGKHPGGPWDPSRSSSAVPVPCNDPSITCSGGGGPECKQGQCAYQIGYEDGSGYSAKVWQDTVTLAGIPINGSYVGGIFKEENPNGPFEPKAVDGIAGFAFQTTSVIQAPTLTDVLHANDPTCPNVFSMCGDLQNGGALTICGIGNQHSHPIDWTPLVDVSSGFYNIHTVDLAVNGTRLGLPSFIYNDGMSTVDSGTTGVYIPDEAIKKIVEVIQKQFCDKGIDVKGVCGQTVENSIFGGGCYKLSTSEIARYPTISIIAGRHDEITIPMFPHGYILAGFCNDDSYYSSNIMGNGATSCLYGDSVMLSNQVIYDKDNLRIGFSEKINCIWQ